MDSKKSSETETNVDPKAFLQERKADVLAFRNALSAESDRGCALLASAYLDKAISDLLFVYLIESPDLEKDLLEGTAPLQNFSARIKMAYYLGLISKSCKRDLDLIRKIRNEFAHHPAILSFDTTAIAQQCSSLYFSYHLQTARPRAHFTAATLRILGHIEKELFQTQPRTEKPDDRPSEAEKEENRTKTAQLNEKIANETKTPPIT